MNEGFYDELDPAGDAYLQRIAYIQLIESGVDEVLARDLTGFHSENFGEKEPT